MWENLTAICYFILVVITAVTVGYFVQSLGADPLYLGLGTIAGFLILIFGFYAGKYLFKEVEW